MLGPAHLDSGFCLSVKPDKKVQVIGQIKKQRVHGIVVPAMAIIAETDSIQCF
jgi:hypothetical protein